MSKKVHNRFSKEEELLLQDFSHSTTAKSSALFYGNALIVSAVPIWLFWRVHSMDLKESAILFTVVTLITMYLVAFAYKNMKCYLKHRVAQKREDAIAKQISSSLDGSKISQKEKEERALWKKNEIADYEATNFSIFYSNTLFLLLIILASFYIFRSLKPSLNYTLSVGGAGAILALFSTGSK